MGIVEEDVARVREQADFVQVASQHIALKKVGSQWSGLCPFHAEKTPSFSINPQTNVWYCFGCSRGGDIIGFVREVEHLGFAEAVERLAAVAGVQLRYDDQTEGRDRQRRSRLVEAMEKAVEWYHQRLLSSPDAAAARGYLRSRGYDGDVVRQFKIGWAPDDWDALVKAVGLPEDVLRDTGLGFVNRVGRQQDSFRARVMFPIFDVQGAPVAFGGRRMGDGEGPKYKNSPETPIYAKRRTLYGLNWAKAGVVEAGEVIVCEGYTDVIGFFTAGMPRAVATCGTALADEHFRALKNFARRVVLAYDADAAGQAAAERFYEWERAFEVDIAVAALPAGADPADVARTDPEGLAKAVAEAQPFLAFRLDRVFRTADLRGPEGRARAADAALAVVAEHPNDLVRDQYLQQVEMRTRIDVARLRERMRGRKRGTGASAGREGPARGPRSVVRGARAPGPETEALRLMMHRPQEMRGRLHQLLFTDDLHLAAWKVLEQNESVHEALATADPAAAELLQRIAVEDTEAEPDDVIGLLLRPLAAQALADLEAEAKAAEDPTQYAEVMRWLQLTMEQVRDPESRAEASGWLLAWLVERSEERDRS